GVRLGRALLPGMEKELRLVLEAAHLPVHVLRPAVLGQVVDGWPFEGVVAAHGVLLCELAGKVYRPRGRNTGYKNGAASRHGEKYQAPRNSVLDRGRPPP